MIVGRHGTMTGVEVFKSDGRPTTANTECAFSSPPNCRGLRQPSIRCRRRSFQVPGFPSNKGDETIVCLGAQVLG